MLRRAVNRRGLIVLEPSSRDWRRSGSAFRHWRDGFPRVRLSVRLLRYEVILRGNLEEQFNAVLQITFPPLRAYYVRAPSNSL